MPLYLCSRCRECHPPAAYSLNPRHGARNKLCDRCLIRCRAIKQARRSRTVQTSTRPPGWLSANGLGPTSHYDHGSMDQACASCAGLHWLSERSSRSSVRNPVFVICCRQGDVELPPFSALPSFLSELLLGADSHAAAFRRNVRKYNNAFAFTSVNYTTLTHGLQSQRGPMDFQIQGILYHTTGPLGETAGQRPQFAQIYFYDPDEAVAFRSAEYDNLD
ncbi:hypothetical protein F5883DRAFT_441816 [Diaporthe sp. PMI_573]|nr:hypothetical protein F5883DRAFT_441816 [Diaporthaceae sp. PMI_573]